MDDENTRHVVFPGQTAVIKGPYGMKDSLDLASAKKSIKMHLRRLEGESVDLEDALLRRPVASIKAQTPHPGYDQSTRDGFVVASGGQSTDNGWCYKIVGEIPAGSVGKRWLKSGTACRIMTGALIPSGGVRVIPQEDCREQKGNILVPDTAFQAGSSYIRKKGCDIPKGQVVVPAGKPILPGHLVLLAATGHAEIFVHRCPRVDIFCTGSELVSSPVEEKEGLKVSGNHYLLRSLVQTAGGIPRYLGTVADTDHELANVFARIDPGDADMILSTGGVGPGKYDLLEEAFVRAGGEILYRSLNVRPGKSTLFGMLGRALFFGLPGPPPAVSALFNELIHPVLLSMQGSKKYSPRDVSAFLLEPIAIKETGVPSFRAAMFGLQDGTNYVRLAGKNEVPDAYILLSGRRRKYKKGDTVKVHLVAACPFSF